MKKLLYIPILLIFVACGEKSPLESKKEELNKLKTEHDALKTKISALEKEIAILDTSSANKKAKLVAVSPISSGNFQHFVDVQGTVDSDENIMVQPGMPGVVTRVYVQEGDAVKTGQILAETDNKAIKESIAQLETNLDFAKIAFDKQKRLWDQKIGTEIQFLQSKNQYESLQKSINSVNAQLEMTRIKSPINGVVDEVNIKIGEFATPSMIGSFRVVNTNKIKVTAKIADSYISKIKMGDPVKVKLNDINQTLDGIVNFIGKSVNPMTRTFQVDIRLNSGAADLRPNMLANVSINDQNLSNVVSIPSNYIQKEPSGGTFVMVTEKKGKELMARKKLVSTGISYNDMIVINEGLAITDELITKGFQDVVDGQLITLK
jgi:membrane fusion protein (multidrug efflux system)